MTLLRSTLAVFAAAAFISACGSAQQDNSKSNSNTGNRVNVYENVDPANMPPGLSTKPIEPSANSTPGIPAANTTRTVPSNVSPAEGIPSADELKKPRKPGATPTPGIPPPGKIVLKNDPPPANSK